MPLEKNKIYNLKHRISINEDKLNKSSISKNNKESILKFIDSCYANGLSEHRVAKYLSLVRSIAEKINKDFDKVTKDDITKYLSYLERSDYAENTKRDYKIALKRFYKWLNGDKEYPELISNVKVTIKSNKKKMPTDLLTEEDVKLLVSNAQNLRDKALLFTLYESGCRIGELASLQVRDVVFDDIGLVIIVDGKTGMRKIRLVASEMYIKNYLNNSNHSNNLNSPLWMKFDGTPMTYSSMAKALRKIVARSKIQKKVTPHLFRHSRATYLARHLTESQLCQYLGWVQGSDMAQTYVHMSGRDTDDAILKIYGKEKDTKKQEKSKLTPTTCPRCKESNEPTAKFCNKCGSPLTLEIAMKLEDRRKEADDVLERLLKDNDIKELISNKLKGI